MGLWDKWKDRRSGRRDLEREVQQLQVVKLRCEIELLRQQLHGSGPPPEAAAAASAAPAPAKERVPPTPRPAAVVKPWGWVAALNARHPAVARLSLTVLLTVGWAVFAFFLCVALFSAVKIAYPDKDFSSSDAAFSLIVGALAGAPVAYAVFRLRAQRRGLPAH